MKYHIEAIDRSEHCTPLVVNGVNAKDALIAALMLLDDHADYVLIRISEIEPDEERKVP